jgi:hypothetical protein
MLRKIISGGQTGADRAGLGFAIEKGLEHGGYVPRGRKAEDGRIVRFVDGEAQTKQAAKPIILTKMRPSLIHNC